VFAKHSRSQARFCKHLPLFRVIRARRAIKSLSFSIDSSGFPNSALWLNQKRYGQQDMANMSYVRASRIEWLSLYHLSSNCRKPVAIRMKSIMNYATFMAINRLVDMTSTCNCKRLTKKEKGKQGGKERENEWRNELYLTFSVIIKNIEYKIQNIKKYKYGI